MLERISAPRNVRLACQVRPHGDVAVQVLLEPISRSTPVAAREPEEIRSFGEERTVTVLVVDMRAFNVLARRQLPYDLVILVNRFIAEMTQAVKAHGGRVETLVTDGITAVFGLNSERRWGSREAILAARDMLKACRVLDAELGSALPLPLRIGIGVHTGRAIVAQIADPQLGTISVTMGETVSIAVRLEAATKSMLADCLVSDAALTASGLKLTRTTQREVLLPGLDKPIMAHVVGETAFEPQVAV
jgi:adenylate cyclase